VTIWTTPVGTTSSAEVFRITSEGDVGINTTTPTEMLEVNGNAKADTVFASAFSSTSPLELQTNKTTRIYVDDVTGNVGIGTAAPEGIFDIAGQYHFPSVDGSSGQVLKTDGNGSLSWSFATGDFSNGGEAGSTARTLGNTDNYSLGFNTNNSTRLHISNTGEVGIGTTNPHGQFEVYKDDGAGTTVGDFVVDSDNKKVYVGKLSTTPSNSTDFIVRNRLGHQTFVVSAANYISFGNYNGSYEQMRVVFDGITFGVGIGTTSPTAKLDVIGMYGYDQFRMRNSYTPSGTSDPNGNIGDVAWDDNNIYIKTSEGWKKAALTTF
jgi:hypothetical protein